MLEGSGVIGGQQHAFLLTPVTVVAVPEPGELALVGAGIIGLGRARRRGCPTGTETQACAG
jgi:hypothetical protein